MLKTAPVWIFWWGCRTLFFFFFSLWQPYFWCASEKRERSQRGGSKSAKPEAGRALMECLRAGEGKAVIRIWMEPQERGRGEGKEEGRGERRIMAELLTTPWIAKEDFLYQCAGVDITAATRRHSVETPGSTCGTGWRQHHMGHCGSDLVIKHVSESFHTHAGRKKLLEWASGQKEKKNKPASSWREII